MKYDAIIALSFGKGKVNKYLAEITRKIRNNQPDINVIVQGEIADNGKMAFDHIIYSHHRGGRYLDTKEVLRQAKEFMVRKAVEKEEDYQEKVTMLKFGDIIDFPNNIILVAHPLHFYRAKHIAEKLGFKVSEGRVDKCLYDKKDPQIWTRNALFFGAWNLVAWLKLCLRNIVGINLEREK